MMEHSGRHLEQFTRVAENVFFAGPWTWRIERGPSQRRWLVKDASGVVAYPPTKTSARELIEVDTRRNAKDQAWYLGVSRDHRLRQLTDSEKKAVTDMILGRLNDKGEGGAGMLWTRVQDGKLRADGRFVGYALEFNDGGSWWLWITENGMEEPLWLLKCATILDAQQAADAHEREGAQTVLGLQAAGQHANHQVWVMEEGQSRSFHVSAADDLAQYVVPRGEQTGLPSAWEFMDGERL